MKVKRIIFNIIAIVLAVVMIYSGYKIYVILDGYHQADLVKEAFFEYKPSFAEEESIATPTVNQGVIDAQKENPDIVGWLTVEGTQIDYPFVGSKDNNDYLRTDLYGNYSVSGTIFMDYQCSPELSDFNTIIYGHEMNNGSMFGDIAKFADESYLSEHTVGYIFLAHATYRLDIYSYGVVDRYDENIYTPHTDADKEERGAVLKYIESKSRQWRNVSVTAEDQIVTLSTCNYEFDGARAILTAKLTKIA